MRHEMQRLRKANICVWREPKTDSDYRKLFSAGVKRIINLRSPFMESWDHDLFDAAWRADRYGFAFLPAFCWPLLPPSLELCEAIMNRAIMVTAAGYGASLVHCRDSVDRTGVVLLHALVQHEGYDFETAWQHVLARGFHRGRYFWWKWILRRRYIKSGTLK